MYAPSATQLLAGWERGVLASPPRRALELLALGWPEHSIDQLAALPLGQRDACLMQLREQWFGANLGLVSACPQCSAQLESCMSISELFELSGLSLEGKTIVFWEALQARGHGVPWL